MKLLGAFAAIAVLPILAIWNGYVLSVLWGWFVVTTFEARPLGVLPSIGVAMVVSYLTKQDDEYRDPDKSPGERLAYSLMMSLIRPAFALVFGWILHSFM